VTGVKVDREAEKEEKEEREGCVCVLQARTGG
jgi:hypothetical protein